MKSAMYSTFAKEYDTAIQDNVYNAHLERPTLQAMLPDLEGATVLDLGCGSGVYAQYLLEQGVEKITCIDASDDMVGLVKQKLDSSRVSAYSQNLAIGLPDEADESADLVISPLMVHYLDDLKPLFADVYRVLNVGGSFVFSTHHPFADFECSQTGNYFSTEKVQEEWNTVGTPVEVTYYRRPLTDITNALTENGLVITQLSEGKVDDCVRDSDPERYKYLSTNPNFIFIKCMKIG